jgi:hypothetical protein
MAIHHSFTLPVPTNGGIILRHEESVGPTCVTIVLLSLYYLCIYGNTTILHYTILPFIHLVAHSAVQRPRHSAGDKNHCLYFSIKSLFQKAIITHEAYLRHAVAFPLLFSTYQMFLRNMERQHCYIFCLV